MTTAQETLQLTFVHTAETREGDMVLVDSSFTEAGKKRSILPEYTYLHVKYVAMLGAHTTDSAIVVLG